MKSLKIAVFACVALIFSMPLASGILAQDKASSRAAEADAVYRNGFVYTADGPRSRAQAFAVRDGKFVKVGSNTI
jgi:hypothetical protein